MQITRRIHQGAIRADRAALTLLLSCMLVVFAASWQTSQTHAALSSVRTTQAFVDSMGVAAHLSARDYPESIGMLEKLRYLGITHLRTNTNQTENADGKGVQSAKLLGQNGVKLHFTTPAPESRTPTRDEVRRAVDSRIDFILRNDLARYTESVEPFNEYDDSGVIKWPLAVHQANAYLYNQRSRISPDVKVLGPSFLGYSLRDTATRYRQAQGEHVTRIFDYGNVHSYFAGSMPESDFGDIALASGRQFNIRPDGNAADGLDARLTYYAWNISKDKPIIITEMGYHNAVEARGGVPETVSATYMPRAYLETFRIGVARSYAYELMNEPSVKPPIKERNFGFFREDGSAKPAATAIHNMTSLLSGGTVTSPRSLPLSFSGDTADLKSMLLQKHEGEYWLALWRKQSVYDTATKQLLTLSPSSTTVSLGQYRTATLFSNLPSSLTEQPLGSNYAFDVPVGADVVFVRIQ